MNRMKAIFIILFLIIVASYCCNAQKYVTHSFTYGFGSVTDTLVIPPVDTIPPDDTTIIPYENTEWGIFVLASTELNTFAKRIHHAKLMQPNSADTIVFRYAFTYGSAYNIDPIKDSGLKVELTFNYNDNKATPLNGYATDTVDFKNKLRSTLLSAAHLPDFLVIRNEPGNYNYWDTSHPERYVNELRAAATVAAEFGIPLSDGGILQNAVYNLYKYYQDNNIKDPVTGKDSTQYLSDLTGITNVNGPAAKAIISWNATIMAGIASIPYIKHVNFHWYEPFRSFIDTTAQVSSHLIRLVVPYLEKMTGKKIWTNETGTRNHTPNLLFEMLDDWKWVTGRIIEYFDGEATDGATSLGIPYYQAYLLQ